MAKKVRTAVIGVGHLGQHHARILKGLENSELVAVVDNNEERAKALAERWHCEALTDYRKLKGRVDAVTVVVPTVYHYDVASWCLENDIHILVEKPICYSVSEAEKLVAIAANKNLTLQVGHIERFNPALRTIRSQIDNVAFIEAHRLSPYPFRSTDIGVIMDVMIHDIDIILSLVNSPVTEIRATATPVLSKKFEDIANVRLQFESGCVANITASRISDKVARKMRMFCNAKYVNLDFAAKQAWIYSKTAKLDDPNFRVEDTDISGIENLTDFIFNDLIKVEHVEINEEGEPLKAELAAFLQAVETGQRPVVDGHDGVKAIALAHAIIDACKKHTKTHGEKFNITEA